MRGLLIAAATGVLSYASFFLDDSFGRWVPGIVFGLLVLGPTQRAAVRFAALVALSTAVYRVAVLLATQLYAGTTASGVWSCALAGVAGALALSVGASAIAGTAFDRRAAVTAAIAGAVGGALIGLAVNARDESVILHVLLASGFVVWQVGYAAAHRLSPWSPFDRRSPATADRAA